MKLIFITKRVQEPTKMSNLTVVPAPATDRPSLTYTILPSTSKPLAFFGSNHELSSSWKRFSKLIKQPETGTTITAAATPTVEAITKGPFILKPATLPEDYDTRVESFMQFLESLDAETKIVNNAANE